MEKETKNCYLLMRKTRAGKSAIVKILTNKQEIQIDSGLKSCTQNVNKYEGEINNLNFFQ
jgi:predicted GTPase